MRAARGWIVAVDGREVEDDAGLDAVLAELAGDSRCVAVRGGKPIPDRLAAPILLEGALDLDRSGGNAPDHRGGLRTANGSVTSSSRAPNRNTSGGRPPLGPDSRRSPV